MSQPISDLDQLLASMHPELNEGVYVFASVPVETDVKALMPVATFCEKEGLTLVVEEQIAKRAGLDVLFRCAWITLTVHSDLQAVGLTAAFAKALGEAGISCNVIAAAYHDHIFVSVDSAKNAMAQLILLQQRARESSSR
ncbi:ACT domain-containing protein [Paraburkholderia sp. CNPSo 3157]|uniref:ACT domain-containing protein n=1 Tax=Paraburkholderia franconis TaxID=2654983 RepID=A0A7X1NAZ1_9BURK|nr:ACT domain-containing protein [Paraburkholderia franconis]MPW18218.1 ACT domain-containing protein [Paraburkholderia franconis]